MPTPIYPCKKDSELLTWSDNFKQKTTATPVTFGLVAAQATGFKTLQEAFAAAYAAITNPNTNSRQATIAKNQARDEMINQPNGARELVDIIQAFPGTTDAMRGELGLRIRDVEPTPVPVPANPPALLITSTQNRTVTLKLKDITDMERRGKPVGVDGATIVYAIGPSAPLEASEWIFLKNTSRTTEIAELPEGVPAGSTVWFTAFWFNQRKQSSLLATAVSTIIGGSAGGMALAA
jgi:hypothetical protein